MKKPTIEIHIITYNEEIMLPFTITHYRRMFGDPKFVIHDNCSTDGTVMLAHLAGATVIPFVTDGLSDSAYTKIKSEAHLIATTDWCLCIDCDEHCYINTEDIEELESKGVNIVQFEGWEVFADVQSPGDIKEFKGHRTGGHDKPTLVKVGEFQDYRIVAGAHGIASLVPNEGKEVKWSKQEYKLLHMKHWNLEFIINRQAEFGRRLSNENRRMGWGVQYTFSPDIHTNYYNNGMKVGTSITDKRINNG